MELHLVWILDEPLFVLALHHLVFEGTFFGFFFATVDVTFKLLFHFFDQGWDDQLEVLVNDGLNILDALDQELLIGDTLFNGDAEGVKGLEEESSVSRSTFWIK